MKKRLNLALINLAMLVITELILLGFLTGNITVTTYDDGGRFYSVTVFGSEYTLIDEPARARAESEDTEGN